MTLPLANASVTVRRPASVDQYDAVQPATTAVGTIPVVLSAPRGRGTYVGATQEVVDMTLICDPFDLREGDQVTDNATSETFRVLFTQPRSGLGLDHVTAGLRRTAGQS